MRIKTIVTHKNEEQLHALTKKGVFFFWTYLASFHFYQASTGICPGRRHTCWRAKVIFWEGQNYKAWWLEAILLGWLGLHLQHRTTTIRLCYLHNFQPSLGKMAYIPVNLAEGSIDLMRLLPTIESTWNSLKQDDINSISKPVSHANS